MTVPIVEVQQIMDSIDIHIKDKFMNTLDWRIEPCFPGSIKWQKDVDIFSFKVYQACEHPGFIPVEKRMSVEFKFQIRDQERHVADIYPPYPRTLSVEQQLDSLLEKFDQAVNKKEHIIKMFREHIKGK